MYYYVPKIHHAIITIAIVMLLIALGARAQGRLLIALNFGALLYLVMTIIILWMLVLKSYDEHWETLSEFAKVYNQLDDEARAALGFAFPTMAYRMKRGEVRGYFESTNVTIDQFRLFLQTSNDKQISPRRDWYTKDAPEWAWEEIKEWLEDKNYIIQDSAAGSHSWLWNGEAYKHLMAYWMAGRELKNIGEPSRLYAYEEE